MTRVRAHVRVWGEVQGVFFRSSARTMADAHGVTGWVGNRPDGSVEGIFEGEQQAVRAIVEWCRHGPPSAEVERMDVEWQPYTGEFSYFSVR